MRDVASVAGVSHQTVSRVLNGSPRVRPDTRRRVLESIETLGYRRNEAARALVTGRGNTVTVVTADTALHGHAMILQGVEEAARAIGHTVSVVVADSAEPASVRRVIDVVAGPGAGGVIVIGFDPAAVAVLDELPDAAPAVAIVEPGRTRANLPTVALDERSVAAEATEYLLALGHRTVHHVAIPSARSGAGRQAGWLDALTARGVRAPAVVPAGWRIADGYAAGRILAADPTVTAVLCGNDDLALGVVRAIHDTGRSVPGDVSVVGFDDVPGAAFWTPSMTTVRLDFAALGRAGFDLVTRRVAGDLDGGGAARCSLPAPVLVMRESTGPPRPGGRAAG